MSIKDLPRSEIEYLINEWILSQRDRKIMYLRLIEGMTIESISEAVDMSPRQVHRIVKKLSAKLQEKGF